MTALEPLVEVVRPRLRGVLHQWAFVLAVPLGVLLVLVSEGPRARLASTVFALTVIAMFAASALYHRVAWSPKRQVLLRRIDHTAIYLLIAGTYTPFGLLALSGAWQTTVLAIVWSGAALAVGLKFLWPEGPRWIAAVVAVGLGWVGVVAVPELWEKAGAPATLLALGGGLFYTLGAVVYARQRPDPCAARLRLPRALPYARDRGRRAPVRGGRPRGQLKAEAGRRRLTAERHVTAKTKTAAPDRTMSACAASAKPSACERSTPATASKVVPAPT